MSTKYISTTIRNQGCYRSFRGGSELLVISATVSLLHTMSSSAELTEPKRPVAIEVRESGRSRSPHAKPCQGLFSEAPEVGEHVVADYPPSPWLTSRIASASLRRMLALLGANWLKRAVCEKRAAMEQRKDIGSTFMSDITPTEPTCEEDTP